MRGVKGTGKFSKFSEKKSWSGRKIRKRHLQPAQVSPPQPQPQPQTMYVPNVIILTPEAVGSMIGVAIATVADKD